MKLILKNGEVKEVDTKYIFNNQYNTVDGEHICDKDIKRIIDDVRLGEFYCSSVKQGTYEEVAQAIADTRAKINQCEGCFWFYRHTHIKDECSRETIMQGNKKIINERTVYEISCAYDFGKCTYDIDETPVLFREKTCCFFCEYPDGIPDMRPLRQFMVDNAEKYDIISYWCDQELSVDRSFKHDKLFGSYEFEASVYYDYFTLQNARNKFKFYVDFANKKFILEDGLGYKAVAYLGTEEYDHKLQSSKYVPIKNYDKFAKWFWQIVDDYISQKEV